MAVARTGSSWKSARAAAIACRAVELSQSLLRAQEPPQGVLGRCGGDESGSLHAFALRFRCRPGRLAVDMITGLPAAKASRQVRTAGVLDDDVCRRRGRLGRFVDVAEQGGLAGRPVRRASWLRSRSGCGRLPTTAW